MRKPSQAPSPLAFVVTAGPTREFIDPVRFLSNPSTGRMGFAVARAAVARGHSVSLVSGPVSLKTPKGVKRIDVTSARDMLSAVLARLRELERRPVRVVFVATAAVADWRPAECASAKLKKGAMRPVLRLVRNPDILKTVSRRFAQTRNPPQATLHVSTCSTRLIHSARHPLLVGFAAETGDPVAEALRKCREKNLAMVVANDVTEPGAGFGTPTNRAALVRRNGSVQRLPLMSKAALARRIVRECEDLCS